MSFIKYTRIHQNSPEFTASRKRQEKARNSQRNGSCCKIQAQSQDSRLKRKGNQVDKSWWSWWVMMMKFISWSWTMMKLISEKVWWKKDTLKKKLIDAPFERNISISTLFLKNMSHQKMYAFWYCVVNDVVSSTFSQIKAPQIS